MILEGQLSFELDSEDIRDIITTYSPCSSHDSLKVRVLYLMFL